MAAFSSCFLPLSVFGNPPSSISRLVGKLPSSRSAITPGLKNVATKCSNAINPSSDHATTEVIRYFHPTVWDGHEFTSASTTDLIDERRLKELKIEVKSILSKAVDSFQELDLIDIIQRLGIAYHFEDEIKDALQRAYNDDYAHFFDQKVLNVHEHGNLCYISLRFRLLRQAGYYVSPDVFKKFKDEKGVFHANLASNVQGMLSLYEASYLGFRGEDIMDEAMAFTTKHLNSMLTCLSSPLALQVQHALKMPIQRIPERVYARYYIPIYEKYISRNKTLMEFSKLDYNSVQLLHQKEIDELQKWWDRIDIKSKLEFDFRNRVVEAYAIMNNTNFEPKFSQGRIHLGKLWTILTVLDDAYDVFGNLNELELLCDAFQRWDANSTSMLSDRMKVVFLEVLNFFSETETDMIKGGNFFFDKIKGGNVIGLSYFKKVIQVHTKNLLEEIKVVLSGELPTLEDWLLLSAPTAISSVFVILSTMNSGELATKEVFEWIASMPKIIKYADMHTRLTGDIASLKVEQERGTNCSCVPCYMMDHGVSQSEATENLHNIITSIWKVMNEDCLQMHSVPMRVFKNLLNYVRSFAFYYDGVDGHTVSDGRTKEIITALFIDPISI